MGGDKASVLSSFSATVGVPPRSGDKGTTAVSTGRYDIAMGDRVDQGRPSVPVRLVFLERAGFESRKKKFVGQLLLDGGTVEEPSSQPLVLSLPHKFQRNSKR